MKTKNTSSQGFNVSFTSPYPDTNIKTLLEEKLLIPRKIRHLLRTKKHLLINNESINWQSPVKKGDLISLTFDSEDYPEKLIPFGDASLVNCLFEDEHLIVVNKPEGMKTHANQPEELALLNHVSAFCKKTCYVIHRLDKETSGAILFAKNPFILPIMNRLLEKREIHRDYWALVNGHFPKKTIVYKDKIGRHRHDRRKRVVDSNKGQLAVTNITRLDFFPNGKSLVNCQLETGRTHQIRVHLSHHGFPIVGDSLYQTHPSKERLMLHAHQLHFVHPLTLEAITLEAKSSSFEALV
ncbi:RluA family pseudouridine synthase [Streptococcus hongkongensis]